MWVLLSDYVYEVMCVLVDFKLIVVLVVDVQGNYIGLIILEDLFQFFVSMSFFQDIGFIIVLEVFRRDYFLVEIVRIVEFEGFFIFSFFIFL